jgi:general secretion pathway protein G
MKRSLSRAGGFTLLEIMLVVCIIMLLLGSAIYLMAPQLGVAKAARVEADLRAIGTALMTYESQSGFMPSTEQGLKALVERPATEPRPRRWSKGMDELPVDPWGLPYNYKQPGTHNPTGYDLFSAGADRQPNTADDVGNWREGK